MQFSEMNYDISLSLARHIRRFNPHRPQDIYLVILKCWQQNTTSIIYRDVTPPYILHTSSIWFKFDLFSSAKLGQGHQNLIKSSKAQMLCPCKFGSNLPTSSGDILHTSVMPRPMLTLTLTRQYVPVFEAYHAKPGYPFLKAMHVSRKFCQRGSKFEFFFCFVFSVDEGIEDPARGSKYHYKWAIIGSPAKRHLNGVLLVGR